MLTRVTASDQILKPPDLWGVIDNEIHAALSWVITAPLDVFKPTIGPLVRTKIIRVGEEVATQVGGSVYRKGDRTAVIADAKIAVDGTAFEAETDRDGEFAFVNIPDGDYVWKIQIDGKTITRKIKVPSAAYDIEA